MTTAPIHINSSQVDTAVKPSNASNTFIEHCSQDIGYRRIFKIPSGFDGADEDAVKVLLEDLGAKVKQIKDEVVMKERDAIQALQEVYYVKTMKIEKKVKKMTIREFNEKFMNCNDGKMGSTGVECKHEESDILHLVKSLTKGITDGKVFEHKGDDHQITSSVEMETPSRNETIRTPMTITRTVKRGEVLYSANGSPVESSEEGDLVATVCKSRYGKEAPAAFDINVGDGRYISLSDPSTLDQMDDQMKNTTKNQLKALHDQMSILMAQLEG